MGYLANAFALFIRKRFHPLGRGEPSLTLRLCSLLLRVYHTALVGPRHCFQNVTYFSCIFQLLTPNFPSCPTSACPSWKCCPRARRDGSKFGCRIHHTLQSQSHLYPSHRLTPHTFSLRHPKCHPCPPHPENPRFHGAKPSSSAASCRGRRGPSTSSVRPQPSPIASPDALTRGVHLRGVERPCSRAFSNMMASTRRHSTRVVSRALFF